MGKQTALTQALVGYEVDIERGFLPTRDPGQPLVGYDPWEMACAQISDLINAAALRDHVAGIPLLHVDDLTRRDDLERAMLLLSFLGHGYLRERDDACDQLPAQLAVPWCKVARRLGRPAVLSHASVVLRNWRRIDPSGPIALGNLATIFQFHGGIDESWFYLVTVEIEAIGAGGVVHLTRAALAAEQGLDDVVLAGLDGAAGVMDEMSATLVRVQERCDPYIFYRRVRPFLSSIENVHYQGVTPQLQSHHGGSAAQSSLFQTYDRVLGVHHDEEPSNGYMREMLRFMPMAHRNFIEWIGTKSLRKFCARSEHLRDARHRCLEAVSRFRQNHLELVAR